MTLKIRKLHCSPRIKTTCNNCPVDHIQDPGWPDADPQDQDHQRNDHKDFTRVDLGDDAPPTLHSKDHAAPV